MINSGGSYHDLYIYLIEGVVPAEDEATFGEQFIGRWIEGESSFLFFSESSREKVDVLLRSRPGLSLFQEHNFSYDEWQGSILEPIRVENFLIVPPWKNVEAENGVDQNSSRPGCRLWNRASSYHQGLFGGSSHLMRRERVEKSWISARAQESLH